MSRKTIPKRIEAKLLALSCRRCAVCYGLLEDDSRKTGQIAHLDGDSSNNELDNLCFLCLEHHDEYDSTTSQSKGLTKFEVMAYRTKLYERNRSGVAIGGHANGTLRQVCRNAWHAGRGYAACLNHLEEGFTSSLRGLIAQTQPFLLALQVGVDLADEFKDIDCEIGEAPPIAMRIHSELKARYGPGVAYLYTLAENIGGSTGILKKLAEDSDYRGMLKARGLGAANLTAVLDEAVQASSGLPATLKSEWVAIVGRLNLGEYDDLPVRIESWRRSVRSIFETNAAA
ncbi:hypothetical protein KAU37_07720 [Candidatus Bipolaricaulota bacterium]|nr:hypothetical protein [Candidatus Bipolaricaulota bacterium]